MPYTPPDPSTDSVDFSLNDYTASDPEKDSLDFQLDESGGGGSSTVNKFEIDKDTITQTIYSYKDSSIEIIRDNITTSELFRQPDKKSPLVLRQFPYLSTDSIAATVHSPLGQAKSGLSAFKRQVVAPEALIQFETFSLNPQDETIDPISPADVVDIGAKGLSFAQVVTIGSDGEGIGPTSYGKFNWVTHKPSISSNDITTGEYFTTIGSHQIGRDDLVGIVNDYIGSETHEKGIATIVVSEYFPTEDLFTIGEPTTTSIEYFRVEDTYTEAIKTVPLPYYFFPPQPKPTMVRPNTTIEVLFREPYKFQLKGNFPGTQTLFQKAISHTLASSTPPVELLYPTVEAYPISSASLPATARVREQSPPLQAGIALFITEELFLLKFDDRQDGETVAPGIGLVRFEMSMGGSSKSMKINSDLKASTTLE